MTTTDDAALDAAMAAATGGADNTGMAVDAVDEPDVQQAGVGPCSPDEARKLIERAVTAASTFQDTMQEMFDRRAHEALGYASPRDMLINEFKGTLMNPRTGRPYGDSHIYRMARVAWLTWAIAERTGIDMADLTIPERTLREIAPGVSGAHDRDLVDQIEARVTQVASSNDAVTADDVAGVVDDVINEAAGRTPAANSGGGGEGPAQFDPGTGEPGARPAAPAATGADGDAFDDGPPPVDAAPGGAPPAGGGADMPPSTAGTGGAAAEAFGDPVPETGAFAGGLDMAAAMEQLREHGDFTRTMQDINEIAARLPTVTAVRDKLPGFLDAVDDDEIHAFRSQLETAKDFITAAADAKAAIDAVLDEVGFRIGDDF